MMALVAVIVAAYMAAVRGHIRAATAGSQSARAEIDAETGYGLAVLDIMDARASPLGERRFAIGERATGCRLKDGTRIDVAVEDAGGRININTAGERLLQAFFLGLGDSPAVASRRTDLIIDFRDADSDRRLNGAELPEYREAGRALGPKNAPLDAIEELSQILEFDDDLIARMRPFVTLHSGTAGLDPDVTSPRLAAIVARGLEQLPAGRAAAGLERRIPVEFIIASQHRAFHITVAAWRPGGIMFVREAVVEFPRNRTGMPTIKEWRRGSTPPESRTGSDAALPSC